jgi:hypothetical protein
MAVPNKYEFRLSPDHRQFAIWEPGNEPWFVPETAMTGRWIKPNDMDRLGWTRYVPVDEEPLGAVEPGDRPRLFHLQRDVDISGVSGTGRVANGVLWPDGSVSLRWVGERPSTVHWERLEDAEAVHGHGGATRIVWAEDRPRVDDPASTLDDTERQFLTFALELAADQMTLRSDEFDDGDAAALEKLRCIATEAQQPRPERGELWSLLDWTFWGSGMGDVFRMPLADTMLAAITPEQREQAEQLMEAWHASGRKPLGRRRYEELSAELQTARDELAEVKASHDPRLRCLIIKPHRDKDMYVGWSNVCEMPVGVWSRETALAYGFPSSRLDRADKNGSSDLSCSDGHWDDKGFIAEQLGWLRRDRLGDYAVEYLHGDRQAAYALLEPFEGETEVRRPGDAG